MASNDPVIDADVDGDNRASSREPPGVIESTVRPPREDDEAEEEDDGKDVERIVDGSDAESSSEDASDADEDPDDAGSVSADADDVDDAGAAPAFIAEPDPPPETPPVRGNVLDSGVILRECRATDAAGCTHATCVGGDFARLGPVPDLAIFARHLVVLDVGDNALGRDADALPVHPFTTLADALPNLRRLAAPCNGLTNLPSRTALAETAGGLRKLVELDLGYNSLDTAALANLAGLPRLVTLNLEGNRATTAFFGFGDEAAAAASSFPALERLDLSDQSPKMSTLGEARHVVNGTFMPNLRVLNLSGNSVTDVAAARALYDARGRLREVGASGNPFADHALAAATRDAFVADDTYGLSIDGDADAFELGVGSHSPRARGRGVGSDRFATESPFKAEAKPDSFVSVRRCELGGVNTLAVPLFGLNAFGKAIGRCVVMLTAPSERVSGSSGGVRGMSRADSEVSFEVEEEEAFGETVGTIRTVLDPDVLDGRYSPYTTTSASSGGTSPGSVVNARPGSPTAALMDALGVSDDDLSVTYQTGVSSNASEAYRTLRRALQKPGVDERDVRAALRGDDAWAPSAARGTAASRVKATSGPRKKAILTLIDAEETRAREVSRDVGIHMGSRLGRVDDILARIARL